MQYVPAAKTWVLTLALALSVSTSEGFCSREKGSCRITSSFVTRQKTSFPSLSTTTYSESNLAIKQLQLTSSPLSSSSAADVTATPESTCESQADTASATLLPQNNSTTGKKSQAASLEERTRRLLYASPPWSTAVTFEEAQDAMIGWSHRHSRKAALMVERLIRRVVQEQIKVIEVDTAAGDPSTLSSSASSSSSVVNMSLMYTAAIRGWTNSGERGAAARRAEEILDAMQQRYVDGAYGIKPEIEAYNLVLLAYARSELIEAPQKALEVLEKLHEWNASGATDIVPNKESYATVLRAFAKTGKPDAPLHVKRLLEHLEGLSQDEGYTCVRPDFLCHGAYVSALIDAMDRDHITGEEAAIEAEAYVYELLASPYEDAKPDAWIFTMVLAAWSKSGSKDMCERAESLLQVFEDYYERSGRSEKTRPTTVSYNFMLACYSRSSLPGNGERARKLLQKMASGNNTFARPDVVSYNSVMSAYGKSRQPRAPYVVEDVLRELHKVYDETKERRLRPNSRSFNTCIDAWAKSNEPGAAARIMDWIVHMQKVAEQEGRRNLRPDKWSFNAFLMALSKSGEESMGDEAIEVLNQMIEYYERGWIELKPCVLTFTNVCHCIAVSGADDALEKSLAIIRRMEDLHYHGFGDVRPNCYTYNCVINAAAKSKRPGKAQIALQLLRRMQEVALRPPTVTYNNVLNACAYADNSNDHPDEILDIAQSVFEEAKSLCNPNYITYSTYLRVICRFVKDGTKKTALTWKIYHECCDAGQLTKMVMRQISHCLTTRQYAELKAHAMDENTRQYRRQYTENVPNKATAARRFGG